MTSYFSIWSTFNLSKKSILVVLQRMWTKITLFNSNWSTILRFSLIFQKNNGPKSLKSVYFGPFTISMKLLSIPSYTLELPFTTVFLIITSIVVICHHRCLSPMPLIITFIVAICHHRCLSLDSARIALTNQSNHSET